jgi:hypothetical protein
MAFAEAHSLIEGHHIIMHSPYILQQEQSSLLKLIMRSDAALIVDVLVSTNTAAAAQQNGLVVTSHLYHTRYTVYNLMVTTAGVFLHKPLCVPAQPGRPRT